MKKSFILSLVMVVILIASLATATYAWYTSQTQVTASSVTVNTAKSPASLVISQAAVDDPLYTVNVVTLTMDGGATAESGINPMIIKSASALTTATTFGDLAFVTTTLNAAKEATQSGVAGVPAVLATVDDSVNASTGTAIYVANPGSQDATYKVTVTIADTVTNNGLRVAIFGGDADDDVDDLTLVGIWAPTADKEVGYIANITTGLEYDEISGLFTGEKTMTDTIVFASGSQSTTAQTLDAITDEGDIDNNKYTVVAWFEGDNIYGQYAAKAATFSISFDIVG